MTTTTTQTTTTQVYRVYIKTTPEAIWDAITSPEWSQRYGFGGYVDYDLRPGGHYKVRPSEVFRAASEERGAKLADVIIDGEVQEADPPRKLVTTFHMIMDPSSPTAAEPPTRITYQIQDKGNGVCSLTLTHELEGAPVTAQILSGAWEDQGAGGGHAWVLSDLKTLLETGTSFNN